MFESVTVIHVLLYIKRIEYKMLGPFSIFYLLPDISERQFEKKSVTCQFRFVGRVFFVAD